jgi:hypothetical protein
MPDFIYSVLPLVGFGFSCFGLDTSLASYADETEQEE